MSSEDHYNGPEKDGQDSADSNGSSRDGMQMNKNRSSSENATGREKVIKREKVNDKRSVTGKRSAGSQRSTLGRWASVLGWTIASVVVFLILSLLLLQTPFSKSLLKTQLETTFNRQFAGELQIGSLKGFIPFQMEVHEVVFSEGGEPVISIASAGMQMDGTRLLQKELLITSFELKTPLFEIRGTPSNHSLGRLFHRNDGTITAIPDSSAASRLPSFTFRVDFPSVVISDGIVHLPTDWVSAKGSRKENSHEDSSSKDVKSDDVSSTDTRSTDIAATDVTSINVTAQFAMVADSDGLLLEAESVQLSAPDLWPEPLIANGALFQTDSVLELDPFVLATGESSLQARISISNEMLFPSPRNSIGSAAIDWEMSEMRLEPSLIRRWIGNFPETDPGLMLEAMAEGTGTGNHLYLDRAEFFLGGSSIRMDGELLDLFGDSLRYSALIRQAVAGDEVASWLAGMTGESMGFAQDLVWEADAEGNAEGLDFGLMLMPAERSNDSGEQQSVSPLRVSGSWQQDRSQLDIDLEMNRLEPGAYVLFDDDGVRDGGNGMYDWLERIASPLLLHGKVSAGLSWAPSDGMNEPATANLLYVDADLRESRWSTLPVDSLVLDVNAVNGTFAGGLAVVSDSTRLSVQGSFRVDETMNRVVLDGLVERFNLEVLPLANPIDYQTDATFSMDLSTPDWNDLFGRLSMQFTSTRRDGMEIRPHQFYLDLNSPDSELRELRFTSSMADARFTGAFRPSDILEDLSAAAATLTMRVDEEILLKREGSQGDRKVAQGQGSSQGQASSQRHASSQGHASSEGQALSNSTTRSDIGKKAWNLEGTFSTKDLLLLRSYVPGLPEIDTQAQGDLEIRSGSEQEPMDVSLRVRTDTLAINEATFSNLRFSMDTTIDPDMPIRESTEMAVLLSFDGVNPNANLQLNRSSLDFQLRKHEFSVKAAIGELRDEFHMELDAGGELSPDWIDLTLGALVLKAPGYQFTGKGEPGIRYDQRQAFTLREFVLEGADDFLSVDGTFSNDPDDYVTYEVRNLDLTGISDVIGGRIGFSGRASGDFSTRTLRTSPIFAGNILIEDGRLNGREVGDLSLESAYNPVFRQFDTEIHLFTDPARYSEYLSRYNTEGQDIFLYGYFKLPDEAAPEEDLFYFDADLKKLDMWFIREIIPSVMLDFEGKATGQGFVRGGGTAFDFSATFDVEQAVFTPQFLNVEYLAEGELIFNYEDGLLFRDVILTDRLGGTGMLNGQIDLDKFSPQNFFNLELLLNDLQFMNNPPEAGVPFFGSMIGTGTASFTGDNSNPILRTVTPVTLSQQSTVSIPLDDDTSVDQSDGFIEFVDSFELDENGEDRSGNGSANGSEPQRRFIDLFTMDLQFVAPNPIQVDLVFDPLTNEVLNARGLGQIRIQLQDQDVNMFGQFNITGGSYQFVAGDIFTRRFTLQEGGSIQWQGDLENAALDVLAVYRTRPDLSTIIPSLSSSQRVPVELNLQIGGTISALENDFYFRIPAGLEGTSDPTITTQINTLNQNDDSKVLQAFSILLTGEFLPADQAQTLGIGENVTGTTALVNPLISSQIITPLLSNQINALLTSDIVLDVDVNLTTNRIGGNEGDQLGVDLDVALRLFDDRIIIRREGQIAGQQSNIGDLGATYRINRIFSVTAFHRQDPTLASRSDTDSQQSQEMNGVGFEARFQFHTWKALKENVVRFFKGLFGG